MLTPQQLTHYREQGFVIPDFRLPASTIQSIKDDFDRLLARYPEFRQNCPALLTYDTTFLNYARNPDILDMVAQILGDDIAIWNSSFFGKPAHDGKRVPWHQDGRYWPIRPLASCSVWIAIDDSNTENGCLRIIPGSHKSRKLFKHENNPSDDLVLSLELLGSEFDESKAVDIVLESGQISLHDVFLVHGLRTQRVRQSPPRHDAALFSHHLCLRARHRRRRATEIAVLDARHGSIKAKRLRSKTASKVVGILRMP